MFKCGFVALVGVPNVGKSALLNALVGEEVAIVCDKPQTTRQQITGMYTDESAQLILWDTPGMHTTNLKLNQLMVGWSARAIREADLVVMVVADGPLSKTERELWQLMQRKPHLIVVNKSDLLSETDQQRVAAQIKEWSGEADVYWVSAKINGGIRQLREELCHRLPEGPMLHEADFYTSHTVRFLSSELIRLAAFERLDKEIPYQLAVRIDQFEEKPNLTRILASLLVERDSQKKIVVGEKGSMIRDIGTAARHAIEPLVGTKVYLELTVIVEPNWSTNPYVLQDIGLVVE